MPAFCAHCGSRLTDEARFCTSCGRPNITPPPVAAPSVPPPLPASPPAAPGTAQAPSGSAALGTPPAAQLSERARTVLTRLLSGDWIAPARIAALPTALLILLALVVTLLSDVPGDDFGDVFFTALAVVMSAVGARPGLELMPVRDTALASAEISVVPLGVTLLWATALWFGARLHLRGAAGSGAARLNSAETALLAVRGVLSAVLGAVVLAWVAGTSIALSDSGGGWDSAAYLLGVEDPTISVTCSPVSAAWWTLLLASAVLFPTLCRTSASEWVARRPGLGAWLRAARHAGVSLAVSLAVAGIAVVVLLVSKGGSAALIPALLLAPNLATTLLGFAWGAPVRFDIEGTGISAAMDSDASGPPWTASLFQLQNLSGWVWTSVLLGVVAAVVLGAGVLREEARPVAAVRAVVSFVSGFLLAVLIAGITVELTFDAGATPWLGRLLEDVLDLPDSSGSLAAEAGLAVPGALFAAAVWGAVGAFGVPAAARRLGVTHLAYLPGLVAFVRGVNTRSGPALTTVTPVPAPTAVPVPVPPAVPVPGPVPVAVAGPVAVADPRPAAGSVPVAGPVTVAGPVAVAD
ncbi:zinc ribbon domain-containing protein, partial [Streptomyces sp. NPDC005046]